MQRIEYDWASDDMRALLDQGFIVKEEHARGSMTIHCLQIAAPLLAAILLKKYKLPVPSSVTAPEMERKEDTK